MSAVAVVDKRRRQQLLRQLLDERGLASQAAVVAALAERGVAVHEATISRDLREVGAVKLPDADGHLVYRLAADPGPSSARHRLAETLQRFVTQITSSGNLAIVRTPPACAHPVASAIDLAQLERVAATVSGDDTVLVVAEEGTTGAVLAAELRTQAGFD